MGKDPAFREKMSDISKKQWQDDTHREKMSNNSKERWKNPDYREKLRESHKEKWQDPVYREKQHRARESLKKDIKDMREFLKDVNEGVKFKDLARKNDLGTTTLNNKIKEKFGQNGPKNYTELKDYLQDKNVEDVVKDIENNNEVKPESLTEHSSDEKQTEEKDIDQRDKVSDESIEQIPEKEPEEVKEQAKEDKSDQQKNEQEGVQSKDIKSEENLETRIYPEPVGGSDIKIPPHGLIRDPNIRDAKPYHNEGFKLTSGAEQAQPVQKGRKDYDGIDRDSDDRKMSDDYRGIRDSTDYTSSDVKRIDDKSTDPIKDYDGIDNPRERKSKDYGILDDGYDEGGYNG